MPIKNILDETDLAGRTLLVRYDLNVSFKDGCIVDDSRLREACTSMQQILQAHDHPPRLVLLAHLGRPKGSIVPEMSLQKVQPALEVLLKRPVVFCPDPLADNTRETIDALPAGRIILLENLRFWPQEESNEATFSQRLAQLGDAYVNEAFSASHRAHASTHGIAQYLPAYAGGNLTQEISALKQCLNNPQRPSLAVVGGAKISTKIGIIAHLIAQLDHVIIGGAMANTFLYAQGKPVGRSLYEADAVDLVTRITQLAKTHNCQLHLPLDASVASDLRSGAEAQQRNIDDIPDEMAIFDAGEQSLAHFCRIVDQCRTVLWNGPLGAFEYPPFDGATRKLAQHVVRRTQSAACLSVAGGGDTLAALRQADSAEGFSHVSSAGGAFLEWLQGDTLPGIAVLEDAAE